MIQFFIGIIIAMTVAAVVAYLLLRRANTKEVDGLLSRIEGFEFDERKRNEAETERNAQDSEARLTHEERSRDFGHDGLSSGSRFNH